MKTPALELLAAEINPDFTLAQIVITRSQEGFEIVHAADRDRSRDALTDIPLTKVREVAQFTADSAFRPLKSAPDLRGGWVVRARDEEELEYALNQLYPGAVADWHARLTKTGQVTNYREFTNRQTGMYRITQFLTDEQAGKVITACCGLRVCLKCRLWSVETLSRDSGDGKSVIPCFEPCAIFLEFARAASRLEQEEQEQIALTPSEIETVRMALEGQAGIGDARRPYNLRRLLLLLQKWPGKTASQID